MDDKVVLAEKLALLDAPFSPGIVGYLNDHKLVVVKVLGEFVWHTHADTDDFFLVLDGRLTIQLRDRDVVLGPGELFVVPRGVEHCPTRRRGDARAADRAARHAEHRRRRRALHRRRARDLAGYARRTATRSEAPPASNGVARRPARPRASSTASVSAADVLAVALQHAARARSLPAQPTRMRSVTVEARRRWRASCRCVHEVAGDALDRRARRSARMSSATTNAPSSADLEALARVACASRSRPARARARRPHAPSRAACTRRSASRRLHRRHVACRAAGRARGSSARPRRSTSSSGPVGHAHAP